MNIRFGILSLMFSLFVMTYYACEHDSSVTINGNNGGGNGNGNGNNSLPPCDPDTVYFEQDILPLLVSNSFISSLVVQLFSNIYFPFLFSSSIIRVATDI